MSDLIRPKQFQRGVAIIDFTDGKQTIIADERTMRMYATNVTYIYTKNGEIRAIRPYGKKLVPFTEHDSNLNDEWNYRATV